MGKRSRTETVVTILQALIEERSCSQKDLARLAEVEVDTVRKHLDELQRSGFPLERDDEPPQVIWSVPKGWFPGAVIFKGEDVTELLRELVHLPQSKVRDKVIERILEAAPRPSPTVPTVLTAKWTEPEEQHLARIEDAQANKVTLEVKYRSTNHPDGWWRHFSVQRVVVGPPARFIAYYHEVEELRWFRVDSVMKVVDGSSTPFHEVEAAEVERMLNQSVDGFFHGNAVRCSFFVGDSDAHWVEQNLPVPMTQERVSGGTRFTATTAGVLRLARYVVGIGGAARVETPELAAQVKELARGALQASGAGEEPSTC